MARQIVTDPTTSYLSDKTTMFAWTWFWMVSEAFFWGDYGKIYVMLASRSAYVLKAHEQVTGRVAKIWWSSPAPAAQRNLGWFVGQARPEIERILHIWWKNGILFRPLKKIPGLSSGFTVTLLGCVWCPRVLRTRAPGSPGIFQGHQELPRTKWVWNCCRERRHRTSPLFWRVSGRKARPGFRPKLKGYLFVKVWSLLIRVLN